METKIEQYTYEEHKKKFASQPEKWNKGDYLSEFIAQDPKAQSCVEDVYGSGQTSQLSRMFDNLPALDGKDIDVFASELLQAIKSGDFAAFTLRQIYDVLPSLVDCNPTLDKGIPNPHYGQLNDSLLQTFAKMLNKTPEEVKEKLYSSPVEEKKVKAAADLMLAALVMAMSVRFIDLCANEPWSKEFSQYGYLASGFSLNAKGMASAVNTFTFKSLEKYTFDTLMKSFALNEQVQKSLEHFNLVIAKWREKKDPIVKEILDMLEKSVKNAQMIIDMGEMLTPDYLCQRKNSFSLLIDEKIKPLEEEKRRFSGGLFSGKSKMAAVEGKITLLKELKDDINASQVSSSTLDVGGPK
ncbi:hypothetical protein ACQUW5_04250 [Legionella sp. CNM-1927-20]|uniref:hypothetical protein n=1 Tax=Legionella sp. CNM-1927-20 TaxID=3422221 RepID=UPI00403AB590